MAQVAEISAPTEHFCMVCQERVSGSIIRLEADDHSVLVCLWCVQAALGQREPRPEKCLEFVWTVGFRGFHCRQLRGHEGRHSFEPLVQPDPAEPRFTSDTGMAPVST